MQNLLNIIYLNSMLSDFCTELDIQAKTRWEYLGASKSPTR